MQYKSRIVRDHWAVIEKYCNDNKLLTSKMFASGMTMTWNDNAGRVFILGKGDPERGKLGLADDVPLPVALEIYLEDGKLRSEQTEHTQKYLGIAESIVSNPRETASNVLSRKSKIITAEEVLV
jgi:hypothetical protein